MLWLEFFLVYIPFQDEVVLLLLKAATVTVAAVFILLRFSLASGPGRLSAAGISFVTALQEAGEFMINFPKACKCLHVVVFALRDEE